uniref:RNA-directed DNA polymerase n=1 Tax=Tanacetum cinerariifolium TaxID=118510 RepID=A0A699HS77_TANCI|nr:RNA-directed DNA polymerase [Tanacetum cinerariifolium]
MAQYEESNVRTVSFGRLRTNAILFISKLSSIISNVTEYAKEFMRLASRNQLSESDAQQVARFNNGLRYDIQAIVSLQTTWTIDEVVRIALKAEQTIKKQGIGSSMYKTKTDINQSSSSQSRGVAQVDHSKSTHEFGGKKKTPTTTTSTHAVNKSSINPYACFVGIKCYRCQKVGYTSNQCRATKRVNLAEGDKAHSKFEDEGLVISHNVVFEDDDDDDHSEAFVVLV